MLASMCADLGMLASMCADLELCLLHDVYENVWMHVF